MSEEQPQNPENEPIEPVEQPIEPVEPEIADESAVAAVRHRGGNEYFRAMMDQNFLEYASYVVKDRAIPDVDDGFKPVQRRILWSLYKIDDGRTHKAANVIGNTMHFHPHGDASIGDALVVLANKEYFITKQGNFGNILTGSPAAAPRYIECSLSPMGREVLFNNDITEFVDSYDGRSQEPVVLPVKIPSLLMLGSDGIAVGMATKIMPHNFNELLNAQISQLRGEPFALYPDFQQGGLMDVSDYEDGNGKITLRAKIDIEGRKLIIREIPATTTTESLIASIEKAAEKNKIKIASVNDYTTQNAEIEIIPTRGYDPERTRQALFMYTDCSVSISVNLTVICESRPAVMSVTEVIKRNTRKLLEYLKRELEIEKLKQEELFHAKTLAQIFFENRIYKRIEECGSEEEEYAEVHSGLAPFRNLLRRDVTNEDVDKLLALPVRRISRFDIEKNQREIAEVLAKMKAIEKNLAHLKDYAISYLSKLLEKYGHMYPRRTEIEQLAKIDRTVAALNNIKIGWDRRNGYIGSAIKSDDVLACNEFDRFVCVNKNGMYKVIALPPEKLFVGKLYDFRKYDANTEFGVIYRETASGKYYGKRTTIGGFILDKEYMICPVKCKLELLTPRSDAIYALFETDARGRVSEKELNLMELPIRTPKARGVLITGKTVTKITHRRYLTPEEIESLRRVEAKDGVDEESNGQITDEITDEIADENPPEVMPENPPEIESPSETAIEEADTSITESTPTQKEETCEVAAEFVEETATPAEEIVIAPAEEKNLIVTDIAETATPAVEISEVSPPSNAKRPRAKTPKVKSVETQTNPADDNDENEFGMIQSEFGF
ncbi:MAG: DNA topoisomerase IV subunit A [Victivallales bacterium]|jgi:topoisomerase-4 subunit A|nr:DNA topoisomerase IV subunit A [Victivallales bacterium]